MLCILYADNKNRLYRIGDEPGPNQGVASIEQVTMVQADGEELEAIRYQVTNLPMLVNSYPPIATVQRWFGDHAKFLVANVRF